MMASNGVRRAVSRPLWARSPSSKRKPTTFGISFGLTTITLAWITGHLQITDRTRWLLLGPLAVATPPPTAAATTYPKET
jgi:hypothetical protein